MRAASYDLVMTGFTALALVGTVVVLADGGYAAAVLLAWLVRRVLR